MPSSKQFQGSTSLLVAGVTPQVLLEVSHLTNQWSSPTQRNRRDLRLLWWSPYLKLMSILMSLLRISNFSKPLTLEGSCRTRVSKMKLTKEVRAPSLKVVRKYPSRDGLLHLGPPTNTKGLLFLWRIRSLIRFQLQVRIRVISLLAHPFRRRLWILMTQMIF